MILGALYYAFMVRETTRVYRENSQTILTRYEKRLEAFFQDELKALERSYKLPGLHSLETVIAAVLKNPNYLDAYILDASGIVLYAGDPLLTGYNYAGKQAYQRALHTAEPFTLQQFHHTERRLTIELVIPLAEIMGKEAFVAVHQLDPAWLEEIITREYLPADGEIIMFNEEGIIFLNIGSPASPGEIFASAKQPSMLDYGLSLLHLQERDDEPRSFRSEDYLVTYRNMGGDQGIIANRISLAIIGEHFRYILMLMLIGAGLGMLLFSLLGVAAARRTMKPLYDLSGQVEQTLQGRREGVAVDPASELAVLARAFNQSWQANLQAQQEYKQLTDEYEKVFNGTQDAMFLVEVKGNGDFMFLRNNLAHQQQTGISFTDIQGKTPRELLGHKLGEQMAANYKACLQKGAPLSYEETLNLPAGERTWATTLTPVYRSGKVNYLVGSSHDITEQKLNREKLEYLGLHDSLTGLYNRAFFDAEMQRLSGSREYPVTIIVADLDGLKLINDTMGHAQGDALIKAGAIVLQNSLRSSDILARIGGDEYAVLLPRTDQPTGEMIVGRIRALLEQHNGENPALPLSIALGVATGEEGSVPLEEIFKTADDLMYRDKLARKDAVRTHKVDLLIYALSERDYMAQGHGQRVSGFCLTIAGKLGLPAAQLIDLVMLAQVHDLGLVGVPESILFKTGPLTADEWEIIKQHPEKGYRIALSSPDLAEIGELILYHHEWWNGNGYLQGLKGEEIPLLCRILAIADAYDVMTSGRPYRKAKSAAEARAELKRCAGTQFDPELVDLALSVLKNDN